MSKAKHLIRDVAAVLLDKLGVTRPARRNAGCLTIATFHRVLPEERRREYPYPGLTVTPEELDWLLSYFSAHFRCGPITALLCDFKQSPDSTPPRLAVTFDDAQLDNYTYARPILARHAVKATFYAPTDNVEHNSAIWHDRLGFAVLEAQNHHRQQALATILAGHDAPVSASEIVPDYVVQAAKRLDQAERDTLIAAVEELAGGTSVPEWSRVMGWSELRDLVNDGHEIGSHSASHVLLPQCDDTEAVRQVTESCRLLRDRLACTVASFCYPNGNFDARAIDAVKSAGCSNAVTTCWGRNAADCSSFTLCRCDIDANQFRDRNGRLAEALAAFRLSGLYPGLR